MNQPIKQRILTLEEINKRAATQPAAFMEQENQRYFDELETAVRQLAAFQSRCLVMLSGPSSSGKTTTALLIRDSLRKAGVDAHTVSLDDFYRGREMAPRLPDGSFDYESPEALNLPLLEDCMKRLLKDGRARMPLYDFHAGRPLEETKELALARDSVVIFEGIHALNPVFAEHLPRENVVRMFVNTISPIYEAEDKLMARRDIRLVRRLLRDFRFRGSTVENTLHMWQHVVRGENLYMFPYVDTVDTIIDTTHAYEPCVFAGELLPLLKALRADHPYYAMAAHLIEVLGRFTPLDAAEVPGKTLLQEFLTGSVHE